MMNQIIIVGRLTSDPVSMTIDNKKIATITLAVNRSFKNSDGLYETDFVDFILKGPMVDSVSEYCKKGDVVGVKGRVENDYKMDGERTIILVAEKVTFLSSTSKKEGEE